MSFDGYNEGWEAYDEGLSRDSHLSKDVNFVFYFHWGWDAAKELDLEFGEK